MATNPNRNNDDDDCCPICLESLHQSPIVPPLPGMVEQSSASSFESGSPSCTSAIGTNVPCGHCMHAACYQQWKTIKTELNEPPSCPTCKSRTSSFVHLHSDTHTHSAANNITIRTPAQSVNPPDSGTVEPHNESPHSVVCVPCGHVYYVPQYHVWMDKTIQLKEQEQKSFLVSTSQPNQQPLPLTQQQNSDDPSKQHGQCPLCNIPVACVLRLYTNIPSNNPISMLNHLIKDSLSSISSNPRVSNTAINQTSRYIATDVMPNRILVAGAGNPVVNGAYMWDGTHVNNANRYVRHGIWNNMVCNFNIFLCRIRSGEYFWFISIVTDYSNECTDADIDFYRAPIFDAHPTVPPQDGWRTVGRSMLGSRPYPMLFYQYYDQVTESVKVIAQLPATIDENIKKSTTDMDESDDISLADIFFHHTIDVIGAGNESVNGTYVYDGPFQSAPRYIRCGLWNGTLHHFYIILCEQSNKTTHWYLSVVPPNVEPGTSSDLDFYTAPSTTTTARETTTGSRMVPPCHGWTAVAGSGGIEPSPHLIHHEYVDVHDSNATIAATSSNSGSNNHTTTPTTANYSGSRMHHTMDYELSVDWEAVEPFDIRERE